MQALFQPNHAFRRCLAASTIVLGAVLTFVPASAGGAGGAHHHAGGGFGEPGADAAVRHEVRIRMEDMSFAPAFVTVPAGETVRFVITNASGIDHDFTLGDAETQAAHRAQMAQQAASGDEDHQHDQAGNAVLVRAGSTRMLIWTFADAGRLAFDCNIPGHYEAGMRGVLEVRPRP